MSDKMAAMVLHAPAEPLRFERIPIPKPAPDQILISVSACGVCRTDLHIVDGDLTEAKLPLVPGHEIVGKVVEIGKRVVGIKVGDRVGVPWLGGVCGVCRYCRSGRENLCDAPAFTGYTLDGGYAAYALADRRFCFTLPDNYLDVEAAPLLCAGLIGYRAYRMAGEEASRLGLYGFGAAAHIICQIAAHHGREVYAFTRPGDVFGQEFARRLGAVWAGGSDEPPPKTLDAAILLAPVGALLPIALAAVCKGGVVVCAGIHMSDIPTFPYRLLWQERVVRTVANLTRRDGEALLRLAPEVPVRTVVRPFPLEQANQALDCLRAGEIEGAAVLIP